MMIQAGNNPLCELCEHISTSCMRPRRCPLEQDQRQCIDVPAPHVQATVEMISPQIAEEMLKTMPYDSQRSIRRYRVQHYADMMTQGLWDDGKTITIGVMDGQQHLLDGQHRLRAIILSNTTQLFTITYQRFTDAASMARHYYHMDTGLPRTVTDAFRATELSQHTSLSLAQIQKLGAAARLIDSNFPMVSLGAALAIPDEITRLVVEWQKEMQDYSQATMGGEKHLCRRMLTAKCLSVALITVRYQRDAALEFWRRVAYNSGLISGQPDHTLARFLTQYNAQNLYFGIYERRVAACWNASFEGRPLSIARETQGEIVILGTPYMPKKKRS